MQGCNAQYWSCKGGKHGQFVSTVQYECVMCKAKRITLAKLFYGGHRETGIFAIEHAPKFKLTSELSLNLSVLLHRYVGDQPLILPSTFAGLWIFLFREGKWQPMQIAAATPPALPSSCIPEPASV